MAKKYIKNVNDNVAIRIMILEGNSFTKKKEYDKALEAYAHALEMLRDHQNDYEGLYLVYINSIEVFINQKNHSKVTEYLDLIMDVFPHLTKMPHYITNAYLDVSDAYSFLKKYDSCEKYLKIALKSAKNKNEKELQSRILLKMFDFYTERDEDEKIDYVMRELTEYISNIPKDDKTALSAKLILYYLKDKDEEKAKKLAQKIINKGGNV
jgi:tetratricopeptide (TPR) repeat protein